MFYLSIVSIPTSIWACCDQTLRIDVRFGVAGPGRVARAAALVVAGGASSPRPRGALQVLEVGAAVEAPADATELEADVGAWRELWGGALDALRREPTINNTEEVVVAQLGAVAFLHCPVRNLGERGVSTPHMFFLLFHSFVYKLSWTL